MLCFNFRRPMCEVTLAGSCLLKNMLRYFKLRDSKDLFASTTRFIQFFCCWW